MPCEMIILRLQLCQSLNFGKVYTAKETSNQYCIYRTHINIIRKKYSFLQRGETIPEKLNKIDFKIKRK